MLNRVAVIVPAHNEEELLPRCLGAIDVAVAAVPHLRVEVVVVLDACTDGTAAACRRAGVRTVVVDAHNVGRARAAGAAYALRSGAAGLWLATTDADSRVPDTWLARQLRHAAAGAEVVVGTVTVDDWSPWPPLLATTYRTAYDRTEGHVHGANLAASATAYLAAGGFPPRPLAEDRAFVAAARLAGRRIVHALDLPVSTSGRRVARAPGGFSAFLARLSWIDPRHLAGGWPVGSFDDVGEPAQ
ncbi:glycosyltransferase family A protein [Asanoa sp. NPDC049573]|uniref:glycosyltransferase n=1 Tax=Asanoa sp. NPDC049573 TaxID=3155396 RepID=UPI0034208F52